MPEIGLVPKAVLGAPNAASGGSHAPSRRWWLNGPAEGLGFGYGVALIALATLYYAAAHLGYAFQFAGPVAAIVWLPVGVGIAFLYLGGLRLWPGVLAGDLLVNNYSALPLGSALGQTLGNLLEVLLAALLIRRVTRVGTPLGSVRNLTGTMVALAVGTAISATIGALSLRLGHVITTDAALKVWRTWWLGDLSGALIVVPLAIAWWPVPQRPLPPARAVEATLLLASIVGLSELALHNHRPLSYLVFPGLIWAALRFGQRGATLAIAIVVGFAVWTTTHYIGPFAFHSLTRSVLSTQLFIGVAALSTLCLAAVVCEREELAERLRTSRARLVAATEAERRRLEQNLHDGAQQRLTAVAVRLGIVSERVPAEPERVTAMIGDARTELLLAIDELRELAHGLHPSAVTRFGLARAIADIADRSPVPIDLLELPSTRVDPGAEATAYYVFAETVANAHRHAHASSIWVRAAVARGFLNIEIADDGIGSAAESSERGLQGLRDRVEALGGRFELDSAPGRGTRVTAAIPATEAST
jgi:signal transduction histidine kinase